MTLSTSLTSAVLPQERLSRLAQQLSANQLDAYYLPPEDEHLNEYLPQNKQRIQWLTGFTGESAPLFATSDKLHLYVDGRFHLQVDDEVDPNVVEAHKLGPDGGAEAAVAETLGQLTENNASSQPFRVGYDPFITSPNRLKSLQKALPQHHVITWVPIVGNLVDAIWSDRPPLPSTPAYAVSVEITGASVAEKLAQIRAEMKTLGANVLPLTALDDIAWLFNIRGGDIPYNPVIESYAMLTPNEALWFVPLDKVPAGLREHLAGQGVTIAPYNAYASRLKTLLSQYPAHQRAKVLVDKGAITLGTLMLVEAHAEVLEKPNPVSLAKACKNPTELAYMFRANQQASRAIIRHLTAVAQGFASGKRYSEMDVRANLEAKYKEEPDFVDLSFPTIPGIAANSAIIHYSKADPNQVGQDGDFYLLDSGCQYRGGTTDTTRTTVFGAPKADQIAKYTAVLKAHIACASLVFPEGTTGIQLDAVCRSPMWQLGLDFAHGTGHGVGAFLNVHEGPNRISKRCHVVFQPGMITSIEPGYYEKDWGGIRLENLYVVVEDIEKPAFLGKKWLKFESLTLVPFEKKLIAWASLTAQELAWLKGYYNQIWTQLSPSLSDTEKAWLQDQCTLSQR